MELKLNTIISMSGITAWQQKNVIHIEIEVNTLINAAVVLVLLSVIILAYQLIKEFRMKHK